VTSVFRKTLAAAVLLGTAVLSAHGANAAESAGDPWKSLRFLMGTWQAKTQGGSAMAASSGTYTFQLELQDHVLARYSASKKCKGPSDFNCKHGDLLYVYRDAGSQSYKAIYFDNEGHVIHYDVTTPAANSVIFLSDASSPGPQFRLVYVLEGAVMSGKFQVRGPGQADFNSYLEWMGAKQ
jgi:hypothetical protein